MSKECRVKITHKRGLHLSPASIMAEKANQFSSEIMIAVSERPDEFWNAKRVIELMSLGAVENTTLIITAQGEDSDKALNTLEKLVKDDFGLSN